MRNFLKVLISLSLVLGCSSTDQMSHFNSDGENFYRVTDFSRANAAAPGYTITVLERCNAKDAFEISCEQVTVNHTASTGIITSLAGPAITGAAVVGSAYLLGEGIADSGDRINSTVNQSGGGSSSNTSVEANSENNSSVTGSGNSSIADSGNSSIEDSGNSSSSGGGSSCHGNCPGFTDFDADSPEGFQFKLIKAQDGKFIQPGKKLDQASKPASDNASGNSFSAGSNNGESEILLAGLPFVAKDEGFFFPQRNLNGTTGNVENFRITKVSANPKPVNSQAIPLVVAEKVEILSDHGVLTDKEVEATETDQSNHGYRVYPGETLLGIAKNLNYQGTAALKAAVAIWIDNQEKFIAGNMNGIRSGTLLDLSYLDERVGQLAFKAARKMAKLQNEKWQRYQRSKSVEQTQSVLSQPKIVDTAFSNQPVTPKKFVRVRAPQKNQEMSVEKPAEKMASASKPDEKLAANSSGAGEDREVSRKKEDSRQLFAGVAQGDTLFEIAKKLNYNKSERAKVVVALWMENPDKFMNGNMNGIQAGQVLHLKALESRLAMLDTRTSKNIIRAQWQEWKLIKQGKSMSTPDIPESAPAPQEFQMVKKEQGESQKEMTASAESLPEILEMQVAMRTEKSPSSEVEKPAPKNSGISSRDPEPKAAVSKHVEPVVEVAEAKTVASEIIGNVKTVILSAADAVKNGVKTIREQIPVYFSKIVGLLGKVKSPDF